MLVPIQNHTNGLRDLRYVWPSLLPYQYIRSYHTLNLLRIVMAM